MSVVILTLNPAFDLHYTVNGFVPYGENYVSRAYVSAGGKGINVSKALCVFGNNSRNVVVLGKDNAADFEKRLNADGLQFIPIYTEGRVRENITVHSCGVPETRISLDTFSVTEKICDTAFTAANAESSDILIFSGRLPRGVEKQYLTDKLSALSLSGVKIVLDSNSLSFDDIARVRPWFIKPNETEIKALAGSCDIKEAIAKFVKAGVENVLVSLGSDGAIGFTDGKYYRISVPKVDALSTVGAGDSTVAGVVFAFVSGKRGAEMFCRGCSFGTAACLTEGTEPPKRTDADRLYESIVYEELL